MRSIIVISFFGILLLTNCTSFNTNEKGKIINENTEWTNTWIVNTNDTIRPKVLLIGDSHVERYYSSVAKNLGKTINCSKFTTSKSLGDPVFIKQLESLLMICKFDVISFNNGLHGAGYTVKPYSDYLPVVYNLLSKNADKSIIWINTTAIREKNNLQNFDLRNKQIIERNRVVKSFTQKNNIDMLDFYSATADSISFYSIDGVHFNKTGVKKQAAMLTQKISQLLITGNQNKTKQ